MYFDWRNETNVNELRRMVELDIRYPEIARRLKTSLGSVCAKVHRLGIGKGPRIPQSSYHKPLSCKAFETDPDHAKVMARQAAEAKAFAGRTVALEDCGERGCHYVIGDPTKRQVCGQPRTRGCYCAEHAQVCFPSPGKMSFRLNYKNRNRPTVTRFGKPQHRIMTVDARDFEVIDGRREEIGSDWAYPSTA